MADTPVATAFGAVNPDSVVRILNTLCALQSARTASDVDPAELTDITRDLHDACRALGQDEPLTAAVLQGLADIVSTPAPAEDPERRDAALAACAADLESVARDFGAAPAVCAAFAEWRAHVSVPGEITPS